MKDKKTQYHFIVGMPRSGTSLLSSELNKYDNVLVTPESKHVIKMLYNPNKYTYTLKEYYSVVKPRLLNKPYTVSDNIQTIIDAADSKNIIKNSIAFCSCFTFIDNTKEANIYIDKNPVYIFHWENIIKQFPSSKFIITIRNPKAFIFSKIEKKHPKERMTSPYFFANLWNEYLYEIFKFQQLYPEKVMLVKYEDLVSDTGALNNISSFLNLGANKEINVAEKYKEFVKKDMSERHKKKYTDLSKPINKSRVNAYENVLKLKVKRRVEYICHKNMSKVGYEIKHNNPTIFLMNTLYLILAKLYVLKAKKNNNKY